MDTVKKCGFMAGMVSLALLFFFLVIPGEFQVLDSLVTTGPDISSDAWLELFRHWATISIGLALAAAVVWFVLGQWFYVINDWSKANNKRLVWIGLLLVSALAAVPSVFVTPPVQEWGRLAWVFYLVNNLALYYLATLWFSPSSFKYQPPLATILRYW
jgi:hypothetical protein